MRPIEIIRDAQSRRLIDEDGRPVVVELLPGMSDGEIEELARTLPCALPPDVRELLRSCRGFHGTVDVVDFSGRDLSFEIAEIFPHGLPIAGDGYGNFWVADLNADSTDFAPIYFACHDAPVILYQSPSLAHFLTELFRMSEPPHKSLIDDVHEDRLFNVWGTNPGTLERDECLTSSDQVLATFARQLEGDGWTIVDLRNAPIGMGFSWGRYGARTLVRRFSPLPVFAYQKPRGGLLSRWFGR